MYGRTGIFCPAVKRPKTLRIEMQPARFIDLSENRPERMRRLHPHDFMYHCLSERMT